MPRELKEDELKGLSEITVGLTASPTSSIKDHHETIKKVLRQRGYEVEHIQYDALEEKDRVIVWKDYDMPLCIAKILTST